MNRQPKHRQEVCSNWVTSFVVTNGLAVLWLFTNESPAIELLPPALLILLCWPYRNCALCHWDTDVIAVNRTCNQLCPDPKTAVRWFVLCYSAYDPFCGLFVKLVLKSKIINTDLLLSVWEWKKYSYFQIVCLMYWVQRVSKAVLGWDQFSSA